MKFPRHSGVLLHPTSLPGPHGSGDLGSAAYHFVDWLQTAGQKLWQILPLGGIGPGNSPYMSSSAFAGNLLLIAMDDLLQHGWLTPADLIPDTDFEPQRQNFAAVWPWRMERLARAAQAFAQDTNPQRQTEFAAFCAGHADWLDNYALFMSLAEH
jgi:4-alpha-glucanotransferase